MEKLQQPKLDQGRRRFSRCRLPSKELKNERVQRLKTKIQDQILRKVSELETKQNRRETYLDELNYQKQAQTHLKKLTNNKKLTRAQTQGAIHKHMDHFKAEYLFQQKMVKANQFIKSREQEREHLTKAIRERKTKQAENAKRRNLSNMEARSKYFQMVQEKKFGPVEKVKKVAKKQVRRPESRNAHSNLQQFSPVFSPNFSILGS